MRPGHRETPLDMRLDLRTQTEKETAFGVSLQVVCGIGGDHRGTGKCDGDAGPELDAFGVLGRDHERQERVVAGFGCDEPVIAEFFELAGPDRDVVERARHDSGIHLHNTRP